MRVSKTRTARYVACIVLQYALCSLSHIVSRNLYAHTYMKDHPSTTTEEFNAVYKALDAKTLEVSSLQASLLDNALPSICTHISFRSRNTMQCEYQFSALLDTC